MRLRSLLYLVSIVSVAGFNGVAQSAKSDSDAIVARLSFHSGEMVIDWRYQKNYPQICLAVYQSRYYQISRLTERGSQTLEGTLSEEDFASLKEMLNKVNFRSEGGGIQYLQGTESVIVEVVRHNETMRHFWVNPGGRNPLPKSAIKVVEWLENFQAPGATPFKHFEASDIRICPSMNENPLPLTSSLDSTMATCRGQRK